jgi:hypothetical protein
LIGERREREGEGGKYSNIPFQPISALIRLFLTQVIDPQNLTMNKAETSDGIQAEC